MESSIAVFLCFHILEASNSQGSVATSNQLDYFACITVDSDGHLVVAYTGNDQFPSIFHEAVSFSI